MKYSAITMPSRTQKREEIYIDRFLGCDYRNGGQLDNICRSPDAVNMDFGDELHMPVKRAGYTGVLSRTLEKPINGLHRLIRYGVEYRLIHAGTKLYLLSEDNVTVLLFFGMADAHSISFTMNNTLYLLDGKEYLYFDGTKAGKVSDIAYVPLTAIAGEPNEKPNKLTGLRRNIFYGNGTTKIFAIDCQNLDATAVTLYVNGSLVPESAAMAIERTQGALVFAAAPASNAVLDLKFSKTVSGSASHINKCRKVDFGKNDTIATFSGNPDTPQTAYRSAAFDPTYFPDDALVFISPDTLPTAECIAPRSTCTLSDEPLFLSRRGVCAVTLSLYNSYYYIQNRSIFINNRLTSEKGLEDAVSVVIKNKLYLFVNGCVYVADGRLIQKSGHDGYQYEWHRWTNVPATAAVAWGERLWFGDSDGNVYRFMTAEDDGEDIYRDLDKPVAAYWTTPFLGTPVTGDGDCGHKKSAPRAVVVLKPFLRSGADIYRAKENEDYYLLKSVAVSLMDFETVDFADFAFHCVNRPRTIAMKNIARRFETLQLMVKSDRPEGLGLVAIQVQMTSGAEVKGE